MLKIKGTQSNKLRLYLYNHYIGILDNDHDTIYLDMSKSEYNNKYGYINLNYELNMYYESYYYNFEKDDINLITNYNIIYLDEEEETEKEV